MKFKVSDFTILFGTENFSGANVDVSNKNTEQKETTKQKLERLPKNVKKFLNLKGSKNTEVKISKNKKGETIYKIYKYRIENNKKGESEGIWTLTEKDILKIGDFLSKKLEKKIAYLNNMNLNLSDIIGSIPTNEINYRNVINNIDDILKLRQRLLKDVHNGYLKDKILKDKNFGMHFLMESLYSINYRYANIKDIIGLVKIYDKKLLKGKTDENTQKSIISNIYLDLADGCQNLDFYENKKNKNIINKLKYQKEGKVSLYNAGMYDRYLHLTDYSSDQLNLSEPINDSFYNLPLENNDDLGLKKKLKQGKKVSVNELIAINLILSGRKELLKGIFDDNALNDIAKKFGFEDIDSFKNSIYKEKIGDKDFDDIYLKFPLKKAIYISAFLNAVLKASEKNKKRSYQNFKQNVLQASFNLDDADKEKFLNVINGELKKGGFEKITIKESNEKYKEEIDNLFLIMNNIESTKIDFDKLLDNFPGKIECRDEIKAKEILSKMFSKDNISKLKEELSKSNLSPMEFVLQQLDQENFFDYFKDNNKKPGDEEKHNMVYTMMENFLKQIKGKQTLDIEKTVENNKKLNSLIEDLGNELFKDGKEGPGKIKKDLALANLKYDIGQVLVNNNTKVLNRDFLIKHKNEILDLIKKQFGVNLKKQGNLNSYYQKIEKLLDNLEEKIPSGGIKIDLDLSGLGQTRKLIESIKKDNKKYEELGYEGYIESQEKVEAEKKMLKHAGTQVDENISLEKSMFKGEQGNEVQTKMKNEGGIYTLQMYIPGEKNVIEVKSLKLEEANKVIMSKYIKKMFLFNLDLEGDSDELNKLISNKTDITKDGITLEDLKAAISFLYNYIYETFCKKGDDKLKKFLKENELNMYDLYNKPKKFAQKFTEGMKKQVNMGGFQADFDKFKLDLTGLDENYFNKNKFKENEEEVKDEGREFFEKRDSSIFSSFTNKVKKIFG